MRGSKPKSNDDNSVFSSTSRTSYKPIDVLPILKQERLEYAKNKGKARKPAEWWGHQTEHSPTSIYRDSFKSNNFQEWIKKVETLPVAGNKSGKIPDVSHTYEQRSEEATTEKKSPLVSWAQYRVRKPASDSSGLGYDIVTGSRVYQATKETPANRISFSKLNAAEQGKNRSYDIISNIEYNVPIAQNQPTSN